LGKRKKLSFSPLLPIPLSHLLSGRRKRWGAVFLKEREMIERERELGIGMNEQQ